MNRHYRIIIFLLLAPIVAQAADRVVARTKRFSMLKNAKECLNVQDPAVLQALPDVRYPFEFEAAPVAPPPKDDAPVVEAPVAEVTDQEVLEKIAPKILPTGIMFRGGKGILILPKGQLSDGSSIKVNYGGKPYIIRVTDVTPDSFTLRLNDAVLLRKIDAGSGRGVTRD